MGLEPTTSGVTGRRSNQLNYRATFGGNNRTRTCDPLLVRQVLSQLSYAPLGLFGTAVRQTTCRIIAGAWPAVNTLFAIFEKFFCPNYPRISNSELGRLQRDLKGIPAEKRLFSPVSGKSRRKTAKSACQNRLETHFLEGSVIQQATLFARGASPPRERHAISVPGQETARRTCPVPPCRWRLCERIASLPYCASAPIPVPTGTQLPYLSSKAR